MTNIRPLKMLKTDFCRFFSKILAEIFSMKEVVFQIFNLNSLFRGVNTFF